MAAVPSRKKLMTKLRVGLKRKKRNYLQGKEDTNFCPDTCTMGNCVHTKSIKRSDDNENGCPTMVKREGKVDEELITV